MTVAEKLRMAAKLVELGVDILEAGFPIASQGDSEAVDAVAREFPWVRSRRWPGYERAISGGGYFAANTPTPAYPYLYRHQRHSSEAQTEEVAPAGFG